MALKVTVNNREVTLRLGELARAIEPRAVLAIANQVMQASIDETFAQEGSPAGSWRRLHAGTIQRSFQQRNSRGQVFLKSGRQSRPFLRFASGKRILTDTGRLRRSIVGRVEGDRLVIGTNLIYARIHQEGGVITPKRARFLVFRDASGKPIFARRVRIPARPFLVIKPEDPGRIVEAVEGAAGDS